MLLRRLARALVVAGTCGLAPAAVAQTGTPLPPIGQSTAAQAPTGSSRLEAIKVELALLSDPATYSQPVEVRLENDAILLVGQVEDESIRRRILEVARQNCYLPISDGLSAVARTVGRPVAAAPLQAVARDALVRQLGSKADRLQIVAGDDGKVTLRGEVGTAEEKLAASRALRNLPGCTRVVNCLNVRSLQQAGHSITVVTGDGHSSVTTPPAEKEPPAADAPRALPSGLPVTRTVNVTTVHNGKEVTRPVVYVVPGASGYAIGSPVPASPVAAPVAHRDCPTLPFHEGVLPHEADLPEKKPSVLRGIFAWRSAKQRQCPPTPELTAMSPLGGYSTVVSTPQTVVMPQKAATSVVPPALPVLTQEPVAEKGVTQEAKPVSVPRPAPSVVQAAPVVPSKAQEPSPAVEKPGEAWPPAHDVRPVTASPRDAIYRSRPLVGQVSRGQGRPVPEPAAPAPVTPMAAKLPPAAAPEPAALPTLQAPLPSQPMRMTSRELIDRVKTTCGKLVRDVKLETAADRTIVVHVYGRSGCNDHLLVGKLLQMPELAASNVRLQVHLGK